MVGIAREVAALFGVSVRLPPVAAVSPPASQVQLAIAEANHCPVYWGTELTGVQIGPSPRWLRQRLEKAGIRSLNNVVDITNYVLLEWGQPLHAFDADALRQGDKSLTLGVRLARAGETLKTLDDQLRTLTPQALVITANDRPVALAGVMGEQIQR